MIVEAVRPGEIARARLAAQPLTWLNLVCLDAPIVAVAWQWLFAMTFAMPLPAASRSALFLTAWLIYLADRFADSFSLPPDAPRSLRQEFCVRHRKVWMCAIAVVALADLLVIFASLERAAVIAGCFVGTLAVIYLLVNQAARNVWRMVPLKEVSIGSLFAAGTLVALVPHRASSAAEFIIAGMLFACVCALNCISIAVWERPLDEAQQRDSIATKHPRVTNYLARAGVVLIALCLVFGYANPHLLAISSAIATSAFCLVALDALQSRIPCDTRTALADLVLLTPLAMFLLQHAPTFA